MARIRSIKPEFPHSESMGRVSRDARLTFILMWTLADDEGRLRGSSRMLASLLYPYDDDAPKLISGWLGELERENCIVVYQIRDTQGGQTNEYIEILNWLSHQKIDHPSKSKIPSRKLANLSRKLALDRKGREGIGEDRNGSKESSRQVAKPTVEQVAAYCEERKNGINPSTFFDFYEANGWVQGKSRKPIKSWKAAVRTWEHNQDEKTSSVRPMTPDEYDGYSAEGGA